MAATMAELELKGEMTPEKIKEREERLFSDQRMAFICEDIGRRWADILTKRQAEAAMLDADLDATCKETNCHNTE